MKISSPSGKLSVSARNRQMLEEQSGYAFPTDLETARALMRQPAYFDVTDGPNANPALRQMIDAFFKLHADGAQHDSTSYTGKEQREQRAAQGYEQGQSADPQTANWSFGE
ncbi:hypothetical protein [Tateyamaria sp.]|uniref:hypothetical protein n=1 Tax=Tateyamaria sp. TaxID=1929288 RepID=UPI00329C2C60